MRRLSIQQYLSSAIWENANGVSDFNTTASQLVDVMAFYNLAFTDVKAFVAAVESITASGDLVTSLRKALAENGTADNWPVFLRSYLTSLYNEITRNRLLIAEEVKLLSPSNLDDATHVGNLSGTRFSRIPGTVRISYSVNALLSITKNAQHILERSNRWAFEPEFREPAHIKEAINATSNAFLAFHDIAADPAFGNCQYGIVPYIFPFHVEDATTDDEAKNSAQWHVMLHQLINAFYQEERDVWDHPIPDDTDDEEVNARRREAAEDEFTNSLIRLAKLIREMLIQIVIDYNVGEDYATGLAR